MPKMLGLMKIGQKRRVIAAGVGCACLLLCAGCGHVWPRGRRQVWPPRGRTHEELGLNLPTGAEELSTDGALPFERAPATAETDQAATENTPIEPAQLAVTNVPVEPAELAVINASAGAGGGTVPRLNPGVRVNVKVSAGGRLEFSEQMKAVSSQGELYLPLVRGVDVTGLTREQAVSRLAQLYKKYYHDPDVEVIFCAPEGGEVVSPWGYVTVTGRVNSPRRIPLTPGRDLTVSEAVTLAGGLATSAKDRSVRITHKGVDGASELRTVNLRKVVSDGRVEDDLVLRAGDAVFVPETIF